MCRTRSIRLAQLPFNACILALGIALGSCGGGSSSATVVEQPTTTTPPVVKTTTPIGEQPKVEDHMLQVDIAGGVVTEEDLIIAGRKLFRTSFNSLDGAGRPATNGAGNQNQTITNLAPENFNRVSGPEANACADCHFFPNLGGSGGNSGNVFVMAENLPNVNFDAGPGDNNQNFTLQNVGNERSTPSLFGSGFIELLAREMTTDLLAIEAEAIQTALNSGVDQVRSLDTKGVNFGSLTANGVNGSVDKSQVDGIDSDLLLKPFHQKGVVTSIRHFTNTALNQHHGIQSSERFGSGSDPDSDGYVDEFTDGDVTAMTIFQATLPAPGRLIPTDGAGGISEAVVEGEFLFNAIGCTVCHVPNLELQSSIFTEPGPYNSSGNLQPAGSSNTVSVDLLSAGPGPYLTAEADGTILVPAYTDLKRHEMGVVLDNEKMVQGGVPTSVFITKKLWGSASEPPFMHHGRALTLREAILMHGGEAQAARDAFEANSPQAQDAILEFLTTLRSRPPGDSQLVMMVPGPGTIGEEPGIVKHIAQADIDAGLHEVNELRLLGGLFFDANPNTIDGAGRPQSTGDGKLRSPRVSPENFNRISGPDSNSCLNCHNVPRGSGGGGIVHNVHVRSEEYDFVNFDEDVGDGFQDLELNTVGNERASIAVLGSGFIEMTAREMTADLIAIRNQANATAVFLGTPVKSPLDAKGVNFGSITANPDGSFFLGDIKGVDTDLIIKPFRQKGTVVSLRDFTNFSTNRHHGMQSSERFGLDMDPDNDGVVNEFTVGDITTFVIYQSLLPVPGRRIPSDPLELAAVNEGEELFNSMGCTVCHIPELVLNDPIFTEPGPYNPPGNLQLNQVPQPFAWDLTTNGRLPRLDREADGTVILPAYTDFKRHDMGAGLAEPLTEGGVRKSFFLTKKLWGMANEPPYMHHGRALTITEAILMHGGEAQASRDVFDALPDDERDSVIDFLNTLQVLPFGSPLVITD
ncbi:MAG: cytochrome c peroxidase [Planctomycetota bacterium]|jgi:cytochrome c peroxidase